MVGVVLTLVCVSAACRRNADGPPVATPSVTIQNTTVPRGRPIDVHYRFEVAPAAPAFTERYIVFVHVLDEHGNRVWIGDHEPPTAVTQWKPGSVIEYTRSMMIPRGAPPGHVTLEVGLYSPATGKRLTLSGSEGDRHSYRVASLDVVREQRSGADVVFISGWYESESPEDAQGNEWRWSKRTATLSVHNPQRDAVLVIEADQPLATGTEAQTVEIQSGASRIGSFTVGAGERKLYRLPVSAAQFGGADVVRFTLSIDRTFTPPRPSGSSRGDQRELGIRVFSASLDAGAEPSSAP
jgi:hypothetical protein